MDYQEAIGILRLKGGIEISGKPKRVAEFFDALNVAVSTIRELKEYKQIGTLEEVREAVEKQKAKKPKNVGAEGYRYTDTYRCPTCGGNFSGTGIANNCYHCGQYIDWGEEE